MTSLPHALISLNIHAAALGFDFSYPQALYPETAAHPPFFLLEPFVNIYQLVAALSLQPQRYQNRIGYN